MRDNPTLSIDVELYQHYLDDSGLTDAEKQELIQTLWNIIVEFVQLGWGVHPLQKLQENSGESAEIRQDSLLLNADMLTSLNQHTEAHHDA
jgi:hypothetical protein